MNKIFFDAHTDAGFFIQALYSFFANRQGAEALFSTGYPEPLSLQNDDALESCERFIVFMPILHESRVMSGELQQLGLRPSIVRAINEKRCVLIFDYCNESGNQDLIDNISRWLLSISVINPSDCLLLCQNRLLSSTTSNSLSILHFDFFILEAIHTVNSLISRLGITQYYTELINWRLKKADITCLNATPRIHRVHTILELIDQGLVSSNVSPCEAGVLIPYVSMRALATTKENEALTPLQISNYLHGLSLVRLLPHLDWLMTSLPLSADSFCETGNSLSNKIEQTHYTNSRLSVVTETGVDNENMRITEKTVKALAMGHPLVVVGHPGSLSIARSFGFRVYDGIIDSRYDSMECYSDRIRVAVESAKNFLTDLSSDRISLDELSSNMLSNLNWSMYGFLDEYWSSHVLSVNRFVLGKVY
jgi:hypothetical protein